MANDSGGISLGRHYDDATHKIGERLVYQGERHLLLFGPNGTGKGTRFLIPNLLSIKDRSIVVIDPKGELAAVTADVNEATVNLVREQDDLAIKRALLQQRVVRIYKRGPLYSVQALFGAQSFGDLIARYKYLHLLTLLDQALVAKVEALADKIARQRKVLVGLEHTIHRSLATVSELAQPIGLPDGPSAEEIDQNRAEMFANFACG